MVQIPTRRLRKLITGEYILSLQIVSQAQVQISQLIFRILDEN